MAIKSQSVFPIWSIVKKGKRRISAGPLFFHFCCKEHNLVQKKIACRSLIPQRIRFFSFHHQKPNPLYKVVVQNSDGLDTQNQPKIGFKVSWTLFFPNSMEKYLGVISWLLFHLIWKNYVPNWDFYSKSWIVDFFTHFTHENMTKSLVQLLALKTQYPFLHGTSKTRNPGFEYPICHYLVQNPFLLLLSWVVDLNLGV